MYRKSEKGQALVIIVISLIALLGFTALAIDGGQVYSDRRHAQNAADAGALAGALQKGSQHSDEEAVTAVKGSVASNGFTESDISTNITTRSDFTGRYILVTVHLTSTTETSFAHLFTGKTITNRVIATAKARLVDPAIPGNAVVAMGTTCGNNNPVLGTAGGGNSGGVETFNGGMFVNVPGSTCCSIDPPTSSGGIGIISHDRPISTVGSCTYAGYSNMQPIPIDTGLANGNPIDDPISTLPEPRCANAGSITGGNPRTYTPGNFNGSDITGGKLNPGIYCITGNVKLAGNTALTGAGVVLYFVNGGLSYTGNAGMTISAPTAWNCQGSEGNPYDSCTYKGIAIFSARNNTSDIDVRGNGGNAVTGLIYALEGTVLAKGGGSNPLETGVTGQIIAKKVLGTGNGSFIINYVEDLTYKKPPELSLER